MIQQKRNRINKSKELQSKSNQFLKFRNESQLSSLNSAKQLTRNRTLGQCFNKYPNCFWLDSQKSSNRVSFVLQNSESIHVQHFIFMKTNISSLQCISEINFLQLKVLCLVENKIESIQGIERINMPNVRQISLRNNKITNASSLRKIIIDQSQNREECLTKLSLDGNKILNIAFLSQSNISLQGLYLDIATYDTPCGIDLRILSKCKFSRQANLCIQSFCRLKQYQFMDKFRQKICG